MTATPAAGSHPAVDTLADLDADALEAAQAAEVRGHVDGCAACTAVLAALDRTRTDLRRLADPPLPSDVAAALDARLAVLTPGGVSGGAGSTVSGEVHPLRAPRRRRWAISLPGAAAAAVATLFVAAIGVGALNTLGDGGGVDEDSSLSGGGTADDSSGGFSAESAPMAAPGSARTTSGRDYTAATVTDVLTAAAARSAAAGDTAGAADAGERTPTAATALAAVPAALQPLTDEATLQSCVSGLADPPAAPLVVDYASYLGKPALVVVLPHSATEVGIWVVGPGCRSGDSDLRFFATAPRP